MNPNKKQVLSESGDTEFIQLVNGAIEIQEAISAGYTELRFRNPITKEIRQISISELAIEISVDPS